MGEKEHTKIFIWPLRGASKVPRDIGIHRFLPKSRFLAKFYISLHNIQGSERPDFLSTYTHIHPNQDGRKRTNKDFHSAPQGGIKGAPRYRNSQIFAKIEAFGQIQYQITQHSGLWETWFFINTHLHTVNNCSSGPKRNEFRTLAGPNFFLLDTLLKISARSEFHCNKFSPLTSNFFGPLVNSALRGTSFDQSVINCFPKLARRQW